MKKTYLFILFSLLLVQQGFAQWPGKNETTQQILLPNGWKLSPAGHSVALGDLPLNMQLSASGKYLAITNNGQSTQSLQLIDPKTEKIIDEKVLVKSWYGIAFSKDEKHLYASGGNDNWILDFNIDNNKLVKSDTIKLGPVWPAGKICPAGIVVNKNNSKLFTVTKEDSALYIIDPTEKKILKRVQLPAIAYRPMNVNSMFHFGVENPLLLSIWYQKV